MIESIAAGSRLGFEPSYPLIFKHLTNPGVMEAINRTLKAIQPLQIAEAMLESGAASETDAASMRASLLDAASSGITDAYRQAVELEANSP